MSAPTMIPAAVTAAFDTWQAAKKEQERLLKACEGGHGTPEEDLALHQSTYAVAGALAEYEKVRRTPSLWTTPVTPAPGGTR